MDITPVISSITIANDSQVYARTCITQLTIIIMSFGCVIHIYIMYTHVHLCFVSAEPVRALSLQACTRQSMAR